MSIISHLNHLQEQQDKLNAQIRSHYVHHAPDNLLIQLKKERLRIQDKMQHYREAACE